MSPFAARHPRIFRLRRVAGVLISVGGLLVLCLWGPGRLLNLELWRFHRSSTSVDSALVCAFGETGLNAMLRDFKTHSTEISSSDYDARLAATLCCIHRHSRVEDPVQASALIATLATVYGRSTGPRRRDIRTSVRTMDEHSQLLVLASIIASGSSVVADDLSVPGFEESAYGPPRDANIGRDWCRVVEPRLIESLPSLLEKKPDRNPDQHVPDDAIRQIVEADCSRESAAELLTVIRSSGDGEAVDYISRDIVPFITEDQSRADVWIPLLFGAGDCEAAAHLLFAISARERLSKPRGSVIGKTLRQSRPACLLHLCSRERAVTACWSDIEHFADGGEVPR